MLLGNQYLCKYLSITFTSYCTNVFYSISTVRPISVFLALERLTLKKRFTNTTVTTTTDTTKLTIPSTCPQKFHCTPVKLQSVNQFICPFNHTTVTQSYN